LPVSGFLKYAKRLSAIYSPVTKGTFESEQAVQSERERENLFVRVYVVGRDEN
jgi:hypothetical protein